MSGQRIGHDGKGINYQVYHFARETLFSVKDGVFEGGMKMTVCPFIVWDVANCCPRDQSDWTFFYHEYV